MLPYRHTQAGTVLRWVLPLSLLPMGLLLWLTPSPPAMLVPMLGLVIVLTLGSLVLMWSLTVEVTAGHFKFCFGPGLIRKSVPLVQVQSCEPVEGLMAWGIHYGGRGRGWLYNVSGRQAVLVHLKDGSAFMVGTDEPQAVCQAVEAARQSLAVANDPQA